MGRIKELIVDLPPDLELYEDEDFVFLRKKENKKILAVFRFSLMTKKEIEETIKKEIERIQEGQ